MVEFREWSELLTASRLDVAGKIPLAKAIISGREFEWPRRLYFEVLRSLNPNSRFGEDNLKFSLHDYENTFRDLAESVSKRGLDPKSSKVQLGMDGTLGNGAHRLSLAALLDLPVPVIPSSETPQVYDWRFFKRSGMPEPFLDELVYQYSALVKRTRAIVASDLSTEQLDRITHELETMSPLVYRKTLLLSHIGIRRVTELMYDHLEWYRPNLLEKLILERFTEGFQNYSATLLLFELDEKTSPRQIKESLRSQLGKDQFERKVHGTDDWHETIKITEAWTNRNSVRFINEVPVGSERRLMSHLKSSSINLPPTSDFVIDAGAALEFHGVRETNDVDHICLGEHSSSLLKLGDCHNEEYVQGGLHLDDLVLNPANFIRWGGFKFSTIDNEFRRLRANNSSGGQENFHRLLESANKPDSGLTYFDPHREERAMAWKVRSIWQLRLERGLEMLPGNLRGMISRLAFWWRNASSNRRKS